MTIIKSIYCSAWQKLSYKLQASTGEREYINTEEVNERKTDEEEYTRNAINRNCMAQS
jgi:hypothetical protein